jgi:hypothetical protein
MLEKPKNSRTGISFSLSSATHSHPASEMQPQFRFLPRRRLNTSARLSEITLSMTLITVKSSVGYRRFPLRKIPISPKKHSA